MKVLHVIVALGIGGAEILLKGLMLDFKRKGIDATIIVFLREENFIYQSLVKNGISVIFCPRNKKFSLINLFFLFNHLKKYKYDVIHSHLTWDQYALAFINFIFCKPLHLVATEHNTVMRRRNNFFIRALKTENWLYKQYKKVICITDEVYVNLTKAVPAVKDKCKIIVNGIDLKKFYCNRSYQFNINDQKHIPIILCVGSLKPVKSQDTLIDAVKLVKRDTRVWLVGTGESYYNTLKQKVHDLGLEKKVLFLGTRKNINQIIRQATIYVQPSLYEGFGIAMLEAMAGGLPVIASDAKGMHELVDGVGMTFSVGDSGKLAQIIDMLLDDSDLLAELSRKSQLKAQQYSIEKTVDLYIDTYNEVMGKKSNHLL